MEVSQQYITRHEDSTLKRKLTEKVMNDRLVCKSYHGLTYTISGKITLWGNLQEGENPL